MVAVSEPATRGIFIYQPGRAAFGTGVATLGICAQGATAGSFSILSPDAEEVRFAFFMPQSASGPEAIADAQRVAQRALESSHLWEAPVAQAAVTPVPVPNPVPVVPLPNPTLVVNQRTPEPVTAARQLFRDGQRAASEGRWSDASRLFGESYRCQSDGTILLNWASSSARANDFDTAIRLYDQLAHDPQLDGATQQTVADALHALRFVEVPFVRGEGCVCFVGGVQVDEPRFVLNAGDYDVQWRCGNEEGRSVLHASPLDSTTLRIP